MRLNVDSNTAEMALRQVREAQSQEVPAHLRDANRDGDAFGDGKGYRYPHAFREHWVAQQYLPSALQGEAFWSPSRQGWEGQRRERMLERRAAQLAASAEAVDEHPLLVSSGPEQPQLERWLQCQLSVEGERLQELRQKLWSDLCWQRTDRVLILGGRSLLWSLDPLGAVAEGGLTILCASSTEQRRLEAQLQLLDPLNHPAMLADASDLERLSPDHQFEVVGGRLNQDDLNGADFETFWARVSSRSTSGAQLRLLLSEPQLGPAGGLLELLMSEKRASQSMPSLQTLAALESIWLSQEEQRQRLLSQLERCGWLTNQSSWQESLKLSVEPSLIERWLGKDRPYRKALQETGEASDTQLSELRRELLQQCGNQLPQSLRHWRIEGRLA